MTLNIIHDDNQFKRLAVLKRELETQGITDYKIWDAVHSDTVIKSINLAHKQIVQDAKERELPFVIIAEDDLQFFGVGAYDYYMNNFPATYDIYSAGIFLGILEEDNTVKAFTGMTCYTVHQNFYNTFLATDENEHIDAALAGKGKYVVCNPFAVRQHNGWSSNSRQYSNYDHIFLHRELYKNEKENK